MRSRAQAPPVAVVFSQTKHRLQGLWTCKETSRSKTLIRVCVLPASLNFVVTLWVSQFDLTMNVAHTSNCEAGRTDKHGTYMRVGTDLREMMVGSSRVIPLNGIPFCVWPCQLWLHRPGFQLSHWMKKLCCIRCDELSVAPQSSQKLSEHTRTTRCSSVDGHWLGSCAECRLSCRPRHTCQYVCRQCVHMSSMDFANASTWQDRARMQVVLPTLGHPSKAKTTALMPSSLAQQKWPN